MTTMNSTTALAREAVPDRPNPLGLAGIEFVEYVTDRPQALGQVLESMGFQPVARHRSREVLLYRQGGMNLVVNAHPEDARVSQVAPGSAPVLAAVAFRVHDAERAQRRCLELGAWDVPTHPRAMELVIPAIRGPGSARFHFVDRWRDFSVFDIDFTPIPTVHQRPPALAGMDYFGVVQYIGAYRTEEWLAYFSRLFGFEVLSDAQRFGIMPKGTLLRSPCGRFFWQLVEPESVGDQLQEQESLQRLGLGVADVAEAVALLRARGVGFVDATELHPDDRGAITQPVLGGVTFELVYRDRHVRPEADA